MTSSITSNSQKTALVVGAGSGIGRATAQLLAQSGLTTFVADLNADAVQDLAASTEGILPVAPGTSWDATDHDACNRLLDEAVAGAGHLDIVISTVGWTLITPFMTETPEYWRRIVDLNLMSCIYLAAAAGRVMKGQGGSIVFTASEAGKVGTSGETVYSAAKAGVIGLVKSLAREFARDGIRINAVAPGITDTPLLESQGGEGLLKSIVKAVPLRRAGQPDEIAAAIAFLASEQASYITGQTLCVGGGLTMGS
jgi:NAD(P)-dependent dehydrogenase (short-subunit alcohol dehydrogenase family)